MGAGYDECWSWVMVNGCRNKDISSIATSPAWLQHPHPWHHGLPSPLALTLHCYHHAAHCSAVLVGGPADVAPGIGAANHPLHSRPAHGATVAGTAGAGWRVPIGMTQQLPPLSLHPDPVRGAAPLRQCGFILGRGQTGLVVSAGTAGATVAQGADATHTPRGQ